MTRFPAISKEILPCTMRLHWVTRTEKVIMDTLEEEWEKCPANALGNTPLHMAAAEGDLETCKMINEVLPNNKNMKNRFGKTPADRARKNGHTEIVDLFNN